MRNRHLFDDDLIKQYVTMLKDKINTGRYEGFNWLVDRCDNVVYTVLDIDKEVKDYENARNALKSKLEAMFKEDI